MCKGGTNVSARRSSVPHTRRSSLDTSLVADQEYLEQAEHDFLEHVARSADELEARMFRECASDIETKLRKELAAARNEVV